MDLKEIIKDEHIEMLVNDLVPDEPMNISIKKNFNTACWSFNQKSQRHSIYIGDKILDSLKQIGKLGTEYYITSFLHHEMSHALNTTRDMVELNEWLKKHKVPFSLFNFFEDARIEYLWRLKTDRMFNWADYEELPEISEDSNATSLLFVYIQKEGKIRSTITKMQRVREYYEQIIECENTFDLYPIMLEWMKEFPETQEDLDQLEKDGFLDNSNPMTSGDLSTTVQMQSSEESAKEMDEDSEDVVGKSPYKDEDNEVELYEQPSEIEYDYTTSNTDTLFDENSSYDYDEEKALKLIPQMQKIFKAKKRRISQSNPTNRINIRSFTNKRFDKLYKKKCIEAKAKKRINLMIDCSGSMGGNPIQNARTFCRMLNEFALRGFIEGHVILTGGDSGAHQCMTFKFPMNINDIASIIADGGAEGLKGTIDKTKHLIKNSDWTFVLTDGNISDNAIDNSKGLNLFGMYVGNPEKCNLSKWFSKYIARETIDELIQSLVKKI
jgi:hypothetical protein